jgi:putative ABC transport system substrate-binding protein
MLSCSNWATPTDDAVEPLRVAALKRGLQDLGWIEGRNLRVESRWAAGEAARMRPLAEELVSLAPEVIVNSGAPTLAALQQTTRTIPLVFAQVLDPVEPHHAKSHWVRLEFHPAIHPCFPRSSQAEPTLATC